MEIYYQCKILMQSDDGISLMIYHSVSWHIRFSMVSSPPVSSSTAAHTVPLLPDPAMEVDCTWDADNHMAQCTYMWQCIVCILHHDPHLNGHIEWRPLVGNLTLHTRSRQGSCSHSRSLGSLPRSYVDQQFWVGNRIRLEAACPFHLSIYMSYWRHHLKRCGELHKFLYRSMYPSDVQFPYSR